MLSVTPTPYNLHSLLTRPNSTSKNNCWNHPLSSKHLIGLSLSVSLLLTSATLKGSLAGVSRHKTGVEKAKKHRCPSQALLLLSVRGSSLKRK